MLYIPIESADDILSTIDYIAPMSKQEMNTLMELNVKSSLKNQFLNGKIAQCCDFLKNIPSHLN